MNMVTNKCINLTRVACLKKISRCAAVFDPIFYSYMYGTICDHIQVFFEGETQKSLNLLIKFADQIHE